jgi:hypothetical protein
MMSWLAPVMIAVSILLLGRAFYLLYVRRRGNRVSKIITWTAALVVVGFWTWRLMQST